MKHPGLTLALTFTYLIWLGCLPVGQWERLAGFALLLWIGMLAAARNPLRLAARALGVTPFSVAALPLIFTVPGPAWTYLAGHPLSQPGCERFLTILLRAWLGAQAAWLAVSLLGRPRLLLALSQLGLPPLLLSIVTLMMRYLDVLHAELIRMNRARLARSAGDRPPSWWWRAVKIGQTAGCLLVRSLDRGDRVYLAMKSRGYDGRERRLSAPARPSAREWLLLMLAQLAMAMLCRPW
ncbi:MAG: cobalt ECF transporter T component CbiQ [Candidatus Eremiobacteraeota bacterium]|nr:cobalt ECF transporter T component CbiQ [Candidatus Eremiobacteraeota bacterium]MCW5867033.1 cobalt ECF transporter T component CbiQ [Candidatus Eremiobacteraeota bacterium]